MKRDRNLGAVSLHALVGALLLSATVGMASAATFVVTTTADTNDGACTVALCSLRDAVIAANAAAGADTITLPAGTYTLTIPGRGENAAATGDLDIAGDLTINGAGAATTIVDGGAIDRVFDIQGGIVVFNGLTIQNGLPGSGESGGGILVVDTSLTLNNCVVTGNHTSNGGGGAGIYNDNPMTINNSTISGNVGGGGANGGGIYANNTLTITGSTISGNSAGPAGGNGGGIYNNSSLTITDSTISGNTGAGGGNGAGLYENSNGNAISRSTFSGNTTNGNGGGIYVNGQPLTLTNVTISGNTAVSGGGVYNNGNGLHFVASTIASNAGGGLANNGSADATGTIIANNGVNCSLTAITDSGTNLQFPGATCGASITSADPLLQPLANNGGPTQTHALIAASPAIDTNTESCPPPPTDQRGVARPQGSACDIGAFELAAGGLPTLSINSVSANEGNSGTTPFVFTVTLSAASASTVTVNFATADGTATAGSDYAATSGTLTFLAGVTTQTITVNVVGDTTPEPNETFTVNLSAPTNATIATATGTGTIINDDAVVAPPGTPIPTLDLASLAMLSVLLVLLGLWAARTRRR